MTITSYHPSILDNERLQLLYSGNTFYGVESSWQIYRVPCQTLQLCAAPADPIQRLHSPE